MQSHNVPGPLAGRGEPGENWADTRSLADDSDGPGSTKAVHSEGVYLGPEKNFPAELVELPLTQVQVLHSRLERQLDWELRCDPEGPHPVTQDRHRELMAELDARYRLVAHRHGSWHHGPRNA